MMNPKVDPKAAPKGPSIKNDGELDDEALEKVTGGTTPGAGGGTKPNEATLTVQIGHVEFS